METRSKKRTSPSNGQQSVSNAKSNKAGVKSRAKTKSKSKSKGKGNNRSEPVSPGAPVSTTQSTLSAPEQMAKRDIVAGPNKKPTLSKPWHDGASGSAASRVGSQFAALLKGGWMLVFFYFVYLLIVRSNALLTAHTPPASNAFHFDLLFNQRIKEHAEGTAKVSGHAIVPLRVLVCLFVASGIASCMMNRLVRARQAAGARFEVVLGCIARVLLFHLFYTATDPTLREHYPTTIYTSVVALTLYWFGAAFFSPCQLYFPLTASFSILNIVLPLYYARFHTSFLSLHLGWVFDHAFYRWMFQGVYSLAQWLNQKCLWLGDGESLPLFTALADDATTTFIPALSWRRVSAKLKPYLTSQS